ncbi:MAG: sugar phosphate isomerase/epimerase [Candidatus Heimdallarchaeota archaeon]|nr:sugar phosphate isomerase/epimerase [Candidatus Heimdallarchaeota archaeon]MBY8995786.1 sugar phosphate isomerase/epimerase [Candidatus Heimdallarchaeota archaeon]
MKIGVTIEPYEGIAAGHLVLFAKIIELDHIEINVNILPEIDGVLENLDYLTTTFHMPIFGIEGYDPGSKEKKHAKKMDEIISFINTYHKDLNMLYTLAHPPESPDSEFDLLMERLQQVNAPIILENIPYQKDEEFVDFYVKAKDVLGKQLAGHAIDGPHRFLTYFEKWLDVPEVLVKDIVYVHLQDTFKEKDDHLPLGQGEMPYQDILKFLKKIGYKGVINQEIKPKGLDIVSIMNSCLNVLKVVDKGRFLKLKAKYAILKPIIKKRLREAAKA